MKMKINKKLILFIFVVALLFPVEHGCCTTPPDEFGYIQRPRIVKPFAFVAIEYLFGTEIQLFYFRSQTYEYVGK